MPSLGIKCLKFGNRPCRWGCRCCEQNWNRSSDMAVVIHLRCREFSISFFTRWPLDDWVQEHWPEVHYKANDMVLQRTTWYLKYDPFPEMRDAPPSDNPQTRLKLSDELQRSIWNIILSDEEFDFEPANSRLLSGVNLGTPPSPLEGRGSEFECLGPCGKRHDQMQKIEER